MSALFADGRIIDVILAMTAIEAIGLVAYHRLTGKGIAPAAFLANLASGCCLLAAVRTALSGAFWMVTASFLLAALVAHVSDLARLWKA